MGIGELSYKKFIFVMLTGMLLMSLALLSPTAGQPSQMENNAISGSNSNLTGYNSTDSIVENSSVGVAPGKAKLYLPLGFITIGKPTYLWSKVKNTQFYNLLVFDTSDSTIINQWFKAEDLKPDRKSRLSATPAIALSPGNYYWEIQTWNSQGITLSDPSPFIVCSAKSPPGKPTLVSPKGNIGTSKPVYVWNPVADASRYHLKVANASDLSNPLIDQWYDAADVTSNKGCVVKPDYPLDPGNYRWWVQAGNCLGNGTWSTYASFTFRLMLPGKVTPISPCGLIATRTPVFVWTASPSATQYHLYVENETDPVFDEVYPAEEVTQGNKCYARSPMILPFDSIDFFWKVQASNDLGDGLNSSYQWFETVCSGETAKTKPAFS